jgi:hypothetical protein
MKIIKIEKDNIKADKRKNYVNYSIIVELDEQDEEDFIWVWVTIETGEETEFQMIANMEMEEIYYDFSEKEKQELLDIIKEFENNNL